MSVNQLPPKCIWCGHQGSMSHAPDLHFEATFVLERWRCLDCGATTSVPVSLEAYAHSGGDAGVRKTAA